MIVLAEIATVVGILSSAIGFLSWYRASVMRNAQTDQGIEHLANRLRAIEMQLERIYALSNTMILDLNEHDYKMDASCQRIAVILQMKNGNKRHEGDI